jgi:hypothetical protein
MELDRVEYMVKQYLKARIDKVIAISSLVFDY